MIYLIYKKRLVVVKENLWGFLNGYPHSLSQSLGVPAIKEVIALFYK